MKQDYNDMCQSDREQRQKEPIIDDRCCLKQLSWILASKIIDLVHCKKTGCTKVGPWVITLEAKFLPKAVLELGSFKLFHHLVFLVNSHSITLVSELDSNLAISCAMVH